MNDDRGVAAAGSAGIARSSTLLRPGHFVVGANVPWVTYGCDFGASAWFPRGGLADNAGALARLGQAFAQVAADGVRVVRMWLLADARSGVRLDGQGAPLGLDDFVFGDVDAALKCADENDVNVIFTLLDFHLAHPARSLGGVQMGGRADWIVDERCRAGLLEAVLTPLLDRYGQRSSVAAWDLMNEPDWITGGGKSIEAAAMRAFFASAAGLVHRHTIHPVTVGSSSLETLQLVRDLGLDFYQAHWYPPLGEPLLRRLVSSLPVDAPVLLGEFPGKTSTLDTESILRIARDCGYCGALGWSLLADDEFSLYDEKAIAAWTLAASTPRMV